mgnify:CR=1 FL=1
MKYYKIGRDVRQKITGVRNSVTQCVNVPNGKESSFYYEKDSPSNYSNERPVEYTNKLYFEMYPKAKITDLISVPLVSSTHLLVSEKFYNLLKGFEIDLFSAHEAVVVKDGIEFKYFYIHFIWNGFDNIDLEKSSFFYTKNMLIKKKIKEVRFNSLEEYSNLFLEQRKSGLRLHVAAEKIVLKEGFNKDLFGVQYLTPMDYLYISESLKESIQENKITGIVVRKQKSIDEFSDIDEWFVK